MSELSLARRAWRRVHTALPVRVHDAVERAGDEARTALDLEPVWDDVRALYRTGLHPAIGLCIRHRGAVVLDRTIGHVEHEPGRAPGAVVTPETPFNLFSASKILTAMVVHALVEDGAVGLEDRMVDHLPELDRHGKHAIRVRHLLAHTAGIPDMPDGIDVAAALRRGRLPIEAFADLPLLSPPGSRVAYHAVTSWSLLEAICERATGTDLRTLARTRLLDPVGLHGLGYGVPHDRVAHVAKHTATGLRTPPVMARIFSRTIGVDLETAIALTNTPEFLTATLPSANVVGTGRDVTRFLQLLLDEGQLDGQRVLRPDTVRRAISETTPLRPDGTFGVPMRYGLGVMRGGTVFSLFGLDTRDAFGHLGFTNVVVYADPSRELAVSFLNTGKPMLAPGMVRWYRVLQRIASTVPRR